jgi:DNA adenine methylase
MSNIKKPFCRVGSKTRIVDKIISMIPSHAIYVEPFIGGGAVYWKKAPSKKEIINDLDSELIKHYKILKTTKERNFKKDMDTLDELNNFVNKPAKTDTDKLLKYSTISCGTYGAVGKGKIYSVHNPYNKFKNIDKQQERLKNTTILNQDYKTVIKKYDSPNTFFYLDPPYEESKTLYKEGTFNYEELNNLLENIKGKFLLTLNDSKSNRTIFKNFKKTSIKVLGQRFKPTGLGGGTRNELIIRNY